MKFRDSAVLPDYATNFPYFFTNNYSFMEPHSSVWYTPRTILHNFRICPYLLQPLYNKHELQWRLEFKEDT